MRRPLDLRNWIVGHWQADVVTVSMDFFVNEILKHDKIPILAWQKNYSQSSQQSPMVLPGGTVVAMME